MDANTTNSVAFDDDKEFVCIEATVGDKAIKVDKREDGLIINNECKRIMRNLCGEQTAGRGNFDTGEVEITQPSYLTPEDRVLFFKTKMFYLLQERHCFLQQNSRAKRIRDRLGTRKNAVIAEAYPAFLSPFGESAADQEMPASSSPNIRKRHHQSDEFSSELLKPDNSRGTGSAAKMASLSKANAKLQTYKTGMAKFLDNIRKADHSAIRMLEEKVLKTTGGAGYASLFKEDDVTRIDVLLGIFADYNLLMQDGKDEESMLNNLANHVRTRIKYFDKLHLFYDNPIYRDDHTAHVFTVPNLEVADINEELFNLKSKQMHQLDKKKVQNLYAVFKDDYSTAKTTLIADGTQPVVLNRKKLDRVKRYVDECADWKGTMLVPYVPEMNFFGLTIPWRRERESGTSMESDFPPPLP